MNDLTKTQIKQMRSNGMSFGQIGGSLGIPVSTIKSFCRRNSITVEASTDDKSITTCQCCGKLIKQSKKQKPKKFCSDRCRNTWWNNNLDKVDRKAYYDIVCAGCGKKFKSYGNANRKYCSHECYIEDRFGGGGHA